MSSDDEEDSVGCVCLQDGQCADNHGNFTSLKAKIRAYAALEKRVESLESIVESLMQAMSSGVIPVNYEMLDVPPDDPATTGEGNTSAEPEEIPEWVLPADNMRPKRQLPLID